MNNGMKTFSDSYLFNIKSNVTTTKRAISDFIKDSTRIDKNSPAFSGIKEDIKRQQTTSLVYSILLMENVHLCINSFEMPRAFKVFQAYDLKVDKSKSAIFIDVTGLIEFKDRFYICKKVDVLTTYLYDALVYLLYTSAYTRVVTNSNIIMNSAKCYASMFCYPIDFLGFNGYKENKNKIKYLVTLFYLNNVIGREIDQSAKNIAANIADVNLTSIGAYDLFLRDINFKNIDTFITTLAKEFTIQKKGVFLSLDTFISKWVYLFGMGTQYGTELFTSFGVMLASTYCGAYILNQKTIEKVCGDAYINFNIALTNLGVQVFGNSRLVEFMTTKHDKNTVELSEALKLRKTPAPKYTGREFKSVNEVMDLAHALKKYYVDSKQTEKIPAEVIKVVKIALPIMEDYIQRDYNEVYQEGNLLKFCNVYKNVFNGDNLRKIAQLIDDHIRIYQGIAEDTEYPETRQRACRCISELREIKQCL